MGDRAGVRASERVGWLNGGVEGTSSGACVRAGGNDGGNAGECAFVTGYKRSGGRAGRRARCQLGGRRGRARAQASCRVGGASGLAMPFPSPDGQVAFQLVKHPTRKPRASLPRPELSPSGDMASVRLIIIIDRRQSQIHHSHRSVDHPWSTAARRPPSWPEAHRPSMTFHRHQAVGNRPSTAAHQSSVVVGRRAYIIIFADQHPLDTHRNRSINHFSPITDQRLPLIITHRSPIREHYNIDRRSSTMCHHVRAIQQSPFDGLRHIWPSAIKDHRSSIIITDHRSSINDHRSSSSIVDHRSPIIIEHRSSIRIVDHRPSMFDHHLSRRIIDHRYS